jgi:hypothetical protein
MILTFGIAAIGIVASVISRGRNPEEPISDESLRFSSSPSSSPLRHLGRGRDYLVGIQSWGQELGAPLARRIISARTSPFGPSVPTISTVCPGARTALSWALIATDASTVTSLPERVVITTLLPFASRTVPYSCNAGPVDGVKPGAGCARMHSPLANSAENGSAIMANSAREIL